MRRDVLALGEGPTAGRGAGPAAGRGEGAPGGKRPSKETLNHAELIRLASGLDPYGETPAAFREAYRSLGIDLVNRVPDRNAPPPLAPGLSRSA